MLEIKSNQIQFLTMFNDFMGLNNYNNLFNVGFRTTDDFSIYLSYIEKKSDLEADLIMREICNIADKCQVDVYLHIVPKDLTNKALTLNKFRKLQNEAKVKLELYFQNYGFITINKQVVNLLIEIQMLRKSKK
jgi:hypothetical protein